MGVISDFCLCTAVTFPNQKTRLLGCQGVSFAGFSRTAEIMCYTINTCLVVRVGKLEVLQTLLSPLVRVLVVIISWLITRLQCATVAVLWRASPVLIFLFLLRLLLHEPKPRVRQRGVA